MFANHDPSQDVELISRFAGLIRDGYEILDFSSCQLKNKNYQMIALNRKIILGRGSYGNVYLAYPLDVATCLLVKEQRLAVKIYKNTTTVNEREANFFDSYYGNCELIKAGEDIFMVMAYLPGHEIMVSHRNGLTLNANLAQFDFPHRVDMIFNIMIAINIIHHCTPSTGCALVHGDINGSNIKVNYDPESGVFDVYIIDFGNAKAIDDDPDDVVKNEMEGTALFMPSEIVERAICGIKSDIFSLTPIFAAVFGATNPFAQRSKIFWGYPEYFKIPYDFTGMFEGYDISEYPCDVRSVITQFLNRMQHEEMENRPDSDEALKFFATLNNLCKRFAANPEDPELGIYAAKLAMLAEGIWGRQDVDDPDNLPQAKAIAKVAGSTPLNSPFLRKILVSSNFYTEASREKESSELDEAGLKLTL